MLLFKNQLKGLRFWLFVDRSTGPFIKPIASLNAVISMVLTSSRRLRRHPIKRCTHIWEAYWQHRNSTWWFSTPFYLKFSKEQIIMHCYRVLMQIPCHMWPHVGNGEAGWLFLSASRSRPIQRSVRCLLMVNPQKADKSLLIGWSAGWREEIWDKGSLKWRYLKRKNATAGR